MRLAGKGCPPARRRLHRWLASRPGPRGNDARTPGPQETTRSSRRATEQLGHRLLMGDRPRPARGHPLPVAGQRGFYLGLLQDLGRSEVLHRAKAPQFRQRDDRGGLPAEVDHLVRLTRVRIVRWLGAHNRHGISLVMIRHADAAVSRMLPGPAERRVSGVSSVALMSMSRAARSSEFELMMSVRAPE